MITIIDVNFYWMYICNHM